MNRLTKRALDQALALNYRLAESAANGTDWLFKRDTLIKSGRTWFELVHDDDLMSVRYYGLPEEHEIELVDGTTLPIRRRQYAVPLVLVPPLGVTTETFDLMPQRSLVRYMAARGFRTYLVDWGKPRPEHAHLDLEDYSYTMMGTALDKVRRHANRTDLSLMGWCMGGLLCLLHQGQVLDPGIRNIITIASPIDLQAEGSPVAGLATALNGPAQLVSNYTNIRMNALDPARMGMPPWLTTLVFKLTDPVNSVTTYWDLLTRLWDREFVESHTTTSDYLNNMLRYPGGVVKDMAARVVGENQLAGGKVQVGDRLAELDRIESAFLAFAGETDHLVSAAIAQKSVDILAATDKEFRVVPGGHMGVMIGGRAQSTAWEQSADWLADRSQANPPAGQRASKARKRRKSAPAGKSRKPRSRRGTG